MAADARSPESARGSRGRRNAARDVLVASEPHAGRLYLANGYMSTALGWDGGLLYEAEPNPCFVRGVYNDAGPGGIDRLVRIPCWSQVRYGTMTRTLAYRQKLDLRRGLARTLMTLEEQRGAVQIEQMTFPSRADPHQAVVRTALRADFDGDVELITGLDAPSGEDVEIVGLGVDEQRVWLHGRAHPYGVEIGMALSFPPEGWQVEDTVRQRIIARRHRRPVRRGEGVTLTQLVRVASSLESDRPLELAMEQPLSFERVLRRHEEAWARLWETDIEIDGDPAVQRFVRAALFYLWSNVRESDRWSIPPMGLSSNGYNGHIFWDAELWMYPSLLVTHPDMARSCLAYRECTIEAAFRRAAENGYRGAQFPWEGGFTGAEMTPTWSETRDFQLHITADVAIAHWWYFLNTGDLGWLRERGWPVIKACAEFWQSRVERRNGRFEVSNVVCADEYAAHVNNDAFTNAAVEKAMQAAIRACKLVGETPAAEWEQIAARMYVPFDPETGHHLEYDGYAGEQTKQADVELLSFPLEYVTDPAQVARDLDYYATVIDPDGPAMSFSVYSIVSAQLGRNDDAYTYLKRSFEPNTREPFLAFSETPTNNEFLFCTGLGGALQALLFGFTGLRLREGYFVLSPLLPKHWKALRFHGLFVSGARIDVAIMPGCLELRRHVDGGPVGIRIVRREGQITLAVDQGGNGSAIVVEVDGQKESDLTNIPLPCDLADGVRVRVWHDRSAPVLDILLQQPPTGTGIFAVDSGQPLGETIPSDID